MAALPSTNARASIPASVRGQNRGRNAKMNATPSNTWTNGVNAMLTSPNARRSSLIRPSARIGPLQNTFDAPTLMTSFSSGA